MAVEKQFIVQLKGREYPTWPGVLSAATAAGLKSLRTRLIQLPAPENGHLAVVMATAEFEDGRVFEDVGDASPASCSPQIAAAALRMASTRAKGRVLRDSLNVGQSMLEELPDLEESDRPRSALRVETGPREPSLVCVMCDRPLTAGQRDVSLRKFGAPLCPVHQREGVRAA
jgi:hypothetical protein